MNFNILQYLPENTKIKLKNEALKELFCQKTLTEYSKVLGISLKNASRYRNGSRAISLALLNRLLDLSKLDISRLQNNIQLKIGATGGFIKIGPFIEINEDWVYISELLKGDGHITSNLWYIAFVNNNKTLIDYVKNFFISLGLDKKHIFLYKRADADFLTIRSSLLAFLLNRLLDVPTGKKHEINIKDFVLENKEFGIAAVRGAFDAEGSVTFTGSRRISITSNSITWINKLRDILNNLRIKSTFFREEKNREKPIYRLFIYHISNLRRFNEVIKPLHSNRKRKLNDIVENYTKNPVRFFHKKVLLSIKNGNLKRSDISNDIKQNKRLVGNNLDWLKKKGFILPYEKIYTNKGSFYKYKITNDGESYLEEMLNPLFD